MLNFYPATGKDPNTITNEAKALITEVNNKFNQLDYPELTEEQREVILGTLGDIRLLEKSIREKEYITTNTLITQIRVRLSSPSLSEPKEVSGRSVAG